MVSVSAPLHRCCINNNVNLLATAAPLRLQKRNNYSVRVRWFARSSPAAAAAAARIHASSSSAPSPQQGQKEKDLVFVAGATGKVGSRTVRELIKLGFCVRAAVRSAERASSLLKSVEQLKVLDPDATAKLEVVECDLEKQPEAGIVAAIGNAALVVCSIGASEKEILDVTGPYRIDYVATNKLVQAATAAKVEHFILVTSLGTSKIGFPASLLNLFWGVLCWKRRAEEALIASGVAYTIVRPGGMERPTDTFKETHNLVLAPQDTYVGGLVSNLQVAELIGCICNCMAKNRKAAYCKVVEVVAETTAPLLPMEDLLARVPSDPGREPLSTESDAPIITGEAPAPAPAASPAAAARAEQPLSPYTAYKGLKPPSSPSPAPTTTRSNSSTRNSDDDDDDDDDPPSPEQDKKNTIIVQSPSRPLSPYTAFVDLKPPTSPSPSPSPSPPPPPPPAASDPDATSTSTTAAADASSPLMDSNANGTPLTTTHPLHPLSPYTRYEELKPPTSPTPSAPKL